MPSSLPAHRFLSIPARDAFLLQLTPFNSTPDEQDADHHVLDDHGKPILRADANRNFYARGASAARDPARGVACVTGAVAVHGLLSVLLEGARGGGGGGDPGAAAAGETAFGGDANKGLKGKGKKDGAGGGGETASRTTPFAW